MTQKVEEARHSHAGEWYAINNEQQRVLGPFRSEQECVSAVGPQDRRRWDVVPLINAH